MAMGNSPRHLPNHEQYNLDTVTTAAIFICHLILAKSSSYNVKYLFIRLYSNSNKLKYDGALRGLKENILCFQKKKIEDLLKPILSGIQTSESQNHLIWVFREKVFGGFQVSTHFARFNNCNWWV